MLPSRKRLDGKQLIRIMEKGRVAHSPFFVVRYLKDVGDAAGPARFGAVAPVKIAGTSAARHLMRRRAYEAVRPLMPRLSAGMLVVAFAKAQALTQKPLALRTDLESVFVKMGVLR